MAMSTALQEGHIAEDTTPSAQRTHGNGGKIFWWDFVLIKACF